METLSRTCSSIPAPHSDKSEASTMTSGKLDEDSFAEVLGRSGHLVVDSEGHRERISMLFNSPEFSDVVILAQQNGVTEGRFCCHRAILCSSSLHFDVLFKTGMQETTTNEVVLEFDADAVRKVLNYCYTGEVLLSDSEIESTLVVADYLAIPLLASACEELVQKRVQPHNVNQYLSFADTFTLHGLQEMCQNFIIDNFCAVIQHPDFFLMSPKTFKFVLQSDSLCIDSEFTIFQALEQWMQHDPKHEAAALELLSLIRYPTMSARELCEVSQSPFVKRHPELTALALQAFTHICSSDDAHMTAACQTYRPRTMQTGVDFQFCMKQESWTAPISGLFRITATGAKAADGLHKRGGLGAVLSGVFHLEKGQRLKVLCGGMSSRSPTGSTGGAGATYVLCDNEDEPLLVAGGGGGTRGMEHDLDGVNATLLPHGADGVAQGKHEEGRGGRDGMGGSGSCFLGVGGGGGGYRSPGTDGNASSENGASLLETTGPNSCTSFGGFGGGGGGLGGGGGGGYSGGGGGPGGGGGGSFVRSDALGVVKEIGSWGHGSAKISFCASLKGRTMPLYKGPSPTARFQIPAIFRTRSSIN